MTNDKEIQAKFELNIDGLLLEIGSDLDRKSILPRKPSEIIEIADIWFKKKRNQFATIVCGNEKIKRLQDSSNEVNQNVFLAAAVADLISGAITGVSPITVAVLIVKKGLDSICKDS